jgi:hypothetical protein
MKFYYQNIDGHGKKFNSDSTTTENTENTEERRYGRRDFHAFSVFSGLPFRLNYSQLRNYTQLKN